MHNRACFCKPFAVNLLTRSKNSWDLQKRTFTLVFRPFEPNWVPKSYFQSNLRFYDCLITRWLPTTSTHVLIERIYCYVLKSNDLKNLKFLLHFSCHFGIYNKFPKFWNKNDPHSSNISEVVDSERCACLNA